MMGREDARNMYSFITEKNWMISASGWLIKKKENVQIISTKPSNLHV
jgi:hypothetical protein